jgi:outer membrane protein assembly factor BamB
LICCLCLASIASTQVKKGARVPLQMNLTGKGGSDPGNKVQMLESPNIDRFLRKAQDFLAREDYVGAISILQDVIEGRTLEEDSEEVPGEKPEADQAKDEPDAEAGNWLKDDPRNAVFSNDERLYRPVRRLCHELLASLPPQGMTLYRSQYEVPAERALQAAGNIPPAYLLEEIYNKYFATLTAARAMARASDLLMDQGKFRAAIQTSRLLMDVYPKSGREEAGISDAYLQLKIALCFQKLGDDDLAGEIIRSMQTESEENSLRIMGEVIAMGELGESDILGGLDSPSTEPQRRTVAAFDGGREELVPLWEYRFFEAKPYRQASTSGRGRDTRGAFVVRGIGGEGLTSAPRVRDYIPGNSVMFMTDRIAFMDNFRLRVCELTSGRLESEGDGPLEIPRIIRGQPRSRVPAYDFSSLRVANDSDRIYALLGSSSKTAKGMSPVTENRIVAYAMPEMTRAWSSDDHSEYRGLTFLATPTVFNQRLLVPFSHGQTFGLQCINSSDGEPVYRVLIHRGGTDMARPPASPVEVAGGMAYVLSNAGAMAAVDAYTGSLRWIRKYERVHPLREQPTRKTSRNRNQIFFGGQIFSEVSLPGFAPSEVHAVDGLVIFAPSDGRVLHCLDGASGEPVWMLSMGELQYLVGHNDQYLFAGGKNEVYCIGLHSGVRLWSEKLERFAGSDSWRGRGMVTDDLLVMPGNRELLVRSLSAPDRPWTKLDLPEFLIGREPLPGPFNVQMLGPYVALSYQGGIELYSSAAALQKLADSAQDPLRRAAFLAQAGELVAAIEVLEGGWSSSEQEDPRRILAERMLSYGRELALAMATLGNRQAALDLLDRCKRPLEGVAQIRQWHLTRLEVFQALGDAEAYTREQDELYATLGEPGRK